MEDNGKIYISNDRYIEEKGRNNKIRRDRNEQDAAVNTTENE